MVLEYSKAKSISGKREAAIVKETAVVAVTVWEEISVAEEQLVTASISVMIVWEVSNYGLKISITIWPLKISVFITIFSVEAMVTVTVSVSV